MQKKAFFKRKWFRIPLALVLILLILIWIAGLYLSFEFERIVKDKINQTTPKALKIDFASLDINLFTRSVEVEQLIVHHYYDTTHLRTPSSLLVSTIRVSGIQLWELLTQNNLAINNALIEDVSISLYRESLQDSTLISQRGSSENGKPFVKKLFVEAFEIKNLSAKLLKDSIEEMSASVHIEFNDVQLASLSKIHIDEDLHLGDALVTINDFVYDPPNGNYKTTAKTFKLYGTKQEVQIDSFELQPRYSKYEFPRKVGKEIDRIQTQIPSMTIRKCDFSKLKDSVFQVDHISIKNPFLKSFRDKRLPFIKKENVPMPVQMLKSLPVKLDIDTLQIINAHITYEEFPEEGSSSGKLHFAQLDASLYNLKTVNGHDAKHIDLDARAELMGAGVLQVSIDLPLIEGQDYLVNGELSDMPLEELNPVVEPLAKMKIESGIMNSISFNFSHNAVESSGEVKLNYENLKVAAIEGDDAKKKANEKNEINKFKTFILNTFVIKKNKDEDVKEDKRTGTITFERDPKRSIFNYWWKSLLTGVASSFGLENVVSPKNDKDNKKEKKKKKKDKK